MFDLSVLKNIDFTNSDNLLFFAIFGILGIIFFLVVLAVLFEFFHAIKKITKGGEIVGVSLKSHFEDAVKPHIQTAFKTSEPEHKITASEPMIIFKKKEESKDFVKKDPMQIEKEKEKKNIEDQLNNMKAGSAVSEAIKKVNVSKDFNTSQINKKESQNKNSSGSEKEKEAENVQNTLNNLKAESLKSNDEKSEQSDDKSSAVPVVATTGQIKQKLKQKDFVLPASPAKKINEVRMPQVKTNTPVAEVILGKKESISQGDDTIFKGKDSMKMKEAVYKMTRKTAPMIKGGLGGTYTLAERREIAKKISDFKKFGTLLEKKDKSRIYRTLAKDKLKASPSERMKIIRQERFLKNTIGK